MTKPRDAGIPMLTMGAGMVAFPAPAGLEDLFSPGLLIAMLTLLGIVPLSRFLDGPDDRLAILKMVAKIFPGLRVFPMKVTAPWYRASAKNWKAKLHWLEATEGTLLHRSEPSRLQIEFRFGKKVPTFGVRPKGRASMYLRIWAGKSCRTGDEDFDRRFVFKAFANTFVDRFRQSGLPKVVRKLALFRRGTIFGISMGGDSGRITLIEPTDNRRRTAKFLLLSFRLAEHVLELSSQAEPEPDAGSGGRICPICGKGMGDDAVKCRKCGRGHHLSCWEYAGTCSDWECGGKWMP